MTTATEVAAVKVGDIFYTSWGYDQTNVDFYKVIGVSPSGKTAKLVEIGSECVSDQGPTTHVVAGGEAAGWKQTQCAKCSNDKVHHEPYVDGETGELRPSWITSHAFTNVYTRRIKSYDGKPVFSWTSYSNAYLWDGKPKYETGAMYGH